jgi:hypothetical protein
MTIEFPKDLYPFPIRVCPCPGLRFYVPIRYGGSFALYAPSVHASFKTTKHQVSLQGVQGEAESRASLPTPGSPFSAILLSLDID